MKAGAKASTMRFGDFQLDASRLELRKNDCRVVAQPKVLQLLLFLVKHRARVVSHDEIRNALWPDEDVGDASVKRAIFGLRQALGDTGESQSAIRTVVGGGYQFVLPIRVDRKTRSEAEVAAARDPFVGRGAVVDEFSQILDELSARRGRVVVLYGAAGVGKTRAAQELAALARRRKALVLHAECDDVVAAPSFAPVIEVLRAVAAQRSADRVRELMGEAAAEVVEAMPDLANLLGKVGPPPAIDEAYARTRLFQGLTRFFRRLADDGPVVLVLDDAHEADALTLHFLAAFAESVADIPVVVLLCATSERPGEEPLLPPALSRAAAATQVHLAPLDRDAVAAYFEHAFKRPVPAGVVDRLNQLTRGNALHCRMIALAFARAGEPKDFVWLNEAARARSLEAAVAHGTSKLPAACRSLLAFASVIGRTFSVALLVRVSNSRWGSVIECLSEGVAQGLLSSESAALASRYRFAHGLLRDVCNAGLSSAARADAHARVALGASALAPDPDVVRSQLAHHSAEAASLVGAEAAIQRLLEAARLERRRMAYERAAALVDRALELRVEGGRPSTWRLERMVERGEMLSLAGDADRSGFALAEAAAMALDAGRGELAFRAAVALCRLPDDGALAGERVSLLHGLQAHLPEDDARRPLALALLASSSRLEGDAPARAELARLALAAAGRADASVQGEVQRRVHVALRMAEAPIEERRQLSEKLLRLARRLESPELLLHAYRGRLEDALEAGDASAVERDAAIIEVLAGQTRHPHFMGWHAAFRSASPALAGRSG